MKKGTKLNFNTLWFVLLSLHCISTVIHCELLESVEGGEDLLLDLSWSTDCGSEGNVTSLQFTDCFSIDNCTVRTDPIVWYNLSVAYYPGSKQNVTNGFIYATSDSDANDTVHLLGWIDPSGVEADVLVEATYRFQLNEYRFKGTTKWILTLHLSGHNETQVCKEFPVTIIGPPEDGSSSMATGKTETEETTISIKSTTSAASTVAMVTMTNVSADVFLAWILLTKFKAV